MNHKDDSAAFSARLSYSRFNRRARRLLPLIYTIRFYLNQKTDLTGRLIIIDSFPVPLCQPIRNHWIKIFRGYVDIGYKATKKVYYYGFKVHALASDEGYFSQELQKQLQKMGYVFWTPWQRNMKGAKEHNDRLLKAVRRTIESDFALLSYYNAENNRARSLAGFQERLEIAVLASNLEYRLERFN